MSIRTALGLQQKSNKESSLIEAHGAALNRMGGATDGLDTIEGVPEKWEEMARLAWHYFVSEPIVNNTVNAWRVFAVGEQINPMTDDAVVQKEIRSLHRRLAMDKFVRDMVLQLLVKGECTAYKQYGGSHSPAQCRQRRRGLLRNATQGTQYLGTNRQDTRISNESPV